VACGKTSLKHLTKSAIKLNEGLFLVILLAEIKTHSYLNLKLGCKSA